MHDRANLLDFSDAVMALEHAMQMKSEHEQLLLMYA